MRKKHILLISMSLVAGLAVPLSSQPPSPARGIFPVREFGAAGNRADNATQAIQAAVDACHAAGGGVVYVEPGEYTCGSIRLQDNVNLHLEAGATLFLSQDRSDFPNGGQSLIHAEGTKNIAVTGRGTLDGLAQYDWTDMRGLDVEITQEIEIARQAGLEMKRYYRRPGRSNCYMFLINDSTDVRLEGITVINSPLWNVRLNDCDRVFIRGVHIYSDLEKGVNADGIDIVSTTNVVISDSIIVTADDAIVLKTIPRSESSGAAKPVENVTVNNCILTSSSTAMMIGTETHADIRHVLFSNSVIRDSNKGFGINVQDGATVSDVVFSHITMDLNRRHWNWWGSAETFKFILKKRTPESKLGAIRDIVIDQVISHARGTSTMTGHTDRRLENITVSNLQMFMEPENAKDKRATHAIQIDGVNRLTLRDVSVNWDENETEPLWKSALALRHVTGFDVDHFRGRQGLITGPAPAVELYDTEGGILHDCLAEKNCGTFVSVGGAQTRNIKLQDNDLEQARQPVSFEQDTLKDSVHLEGRH
ncbi:MAG: glycoside hydrolase family 28 protein [bacterium]